MLYKTCYHSDVLTLLALTTVSASTAALDQIMEPVESSICYGTNLSATTMLMVLLKASVHLLQVENAIVLADAVLLYCSVQGFLGLGQQTKQDASDLIQAFLLF